MYYPQEMRLIRYWDEEQKREFMFLTNAMHLTSLQILSISLTDKTHLTDLFDKTKFKNDKDRCGSSKPNLFNF